MDMSIQSRVLTRRVYKSTRVYDIHESMTYTSLWHTRVYDIRCHAARNKHPSCCISSKVQLFNIKKPQYIFVAAFRDSALSPRNNFADEGSYAKLPAPA